MLTALDDAIGGAGTGPLCGGGAAPSASKDDDASCGAEPIAGRCAGEEVDGSACGTTAGAACCCTAAEDDDEDEEADAAADDWCAAGRTGDGTRTVGRADGGDDAGACVDESGRGAAAALELDDDDEEEVGAVSDAGSGTRAAKTWSDVVGAGTNAAACALSGRSRTVAEAAAALAVVVGTAPSTARPATGGGCGASSELGGAATGPAVAAESQCEPGGAAAGITVRASTVGIGAPLWRCIRPACFSAL